MNPDQLKKQRQEKKDLGRRIDDYTILHKETLEAKHRIKLMELHRYFYWKFGEEYKGQVS